MHPVRRSQDVQVDLRYDNDRERRLCNGCYGQLLAIYEVKMGPLKDDDRSAALGTVLLTFASEAETKTAARRARLREGYESDLDPITVRFIGTGTSVAEHLSELDLDWSAAIICLCKALEYELVGRLIDPLRARFGGRADELSQDRQDPELARLAAYLSASERSRPPEMGWIATFLVTSVNSEQRAATSSLIQAFRESLLRMPGHTRGYHPEMRQRLSPTSPGRTETRPHTLRF